MTILCMDPSPTVVPVKLKEHALVSRGLCQHHIWLVLVSCFAHNRLQDGLSLYAGCCA
jgi:hypothetical protein